MSKKIGLFHLISPSAVEDRGPKLLEGLKGFIPNIFQTGLFHFPDRSLSFSRQVSFIFRTGLFHFPDRSTRGGGICPLTGGVFPEGA